MTTGTQKAKTNQINQQGHKEPGRASNGTVQLALPVAKPEAKAYVARHIDMQLSGDQAAALRRIFDGLQAEAVRLDNGRFVQTPADAVRYVLERVGAAGVVN